MGKKKKTVVICGAGADRAAGMPVAYELVPEIRRFLKDDGKVIDDIIRDSKVLPYLRFDYDKFIDDAISGLSQDFRPISSIITGIREILNSNSDNVTEDDVKKGNLIVMLLSKIQGIPAGTEVTGELEDLIREIYRNTIPLHDDYLIDTSKIAFTGIFNKVMHKLIEDGLEDPDNSVLSHLNKNLINLEQLLMKSFVGFYTGKMSDIKRFLYLSWTLWAFMKHHENIAINSGNPIPFYSSLHDDWTVVTLNYTSFARRRFGNNALYFHGSLSSFIDMQGRQESIDPYEDLEIARFIEETVVRKISLEDENDLKYIIPSIIPPLQIKPLISSNFIDTWYESKKALDRSERIIVVGYSFSITDGHLNDLIRINNEEGKEIWIVNPDKNMRETVKRIFKLEPDEYDRTLYDGIVCYYYGDKLKIFEAEATQLKRIVSAL